MLSFNEFPSIFIYAGGAGGARKSSPSNFGLVGNYTPITGGLVWELNGHENYQGWYETLNIDASYAVGAEANLFRSPEAIPFRDENPGSWGGTIGPNGGGGAGIAFNNTCYIEVTSLQFWYYLLTGDFKGAIQPCLP